MLDNRHSLFAPALALGLLAAIGLGIAGFLVGQGVERFRSGVRTVTVKGLVEKEVASDLAIWTIGFRRADDNVARARDQVAKDRDAALLFLQSRGFTDAEIERSPMRIVDKLSREYGQTQDERNRFIISAAVIVRSPRVDLVQASQEATDELTRAGVLIDGQRDGMPANPAFLYTQFNALRPQLIAEATRSARAMAEQFAQDSGNKVGAIRSANQGLIQIFGADGGDESGAYNANIAVKKKLRVVSTIEFELKD